MNEKYSETPRTDELSKIVQNQNWGFRDMQILAGKLERELNDANDKLAAVLMLCAENGINVKSITVAAMPNVES
jgi:hypothetical protein